MTSDELRKRSKNHALRIIKLYNSLKPSTLDQTLGRQLLRSGTSVGAHYREACRAKSKADFISKMEGALQELDGTAYWLELLDDAGVVRPTKLGELMKETDEMTSIFVASVRRVKNLARAK